MYGALIGLRVRRGTVLVVSLVLLAVLIAASTGIPAAFFATAGLGVLIIASVMLTFRGATLWQWRRIFRVGNAPVTPVRYGSYNGAGWVWDGEMKSVWVEVTASQPFQIATISPAGKVSVPHINTRRLARKMHQRDIVCHSLRVVTHGYRTALDISHRASAAVSDTTGSTPVFIGGRTFVVVSVAMDESLAAIRVRHRDGGPDAVVVEAASRVRVEMEAQGFTARLLSEQALRAVGYDQMVQVSGALEHIGTRHLGDESTMKVFSVVARGSSWSETAQQQVRQVPAHRTYENLVIHGGPTGVSGMSYGLNFVAQSDRIASSLRGHGLKFASGQQVAGLAQVLPSVVSSGYVMPRHALGGNSPVAYPGGIGMYLGSNSTDGRAFVRVAGGMGETLWLVGSGQMARHMVLRMVPLALSIDIRVQGPQAHMWEEFVRLVNSPLITFHKGGRADVIVCLSEHVQSYQSDHQTVVAVAETIPFSPDFSIVEQGSSLVCTVGRNQVTVSWQFPSNEHPFLPDAALAAQ